MRGPGQGDGLDGLKVGQLRTMPVQETGGTAWTSSHLAARPMPTLPTGTPSPYLSQINGERLMQS